MDTEAIFKVEHVSFAYDGDHVALDQVDLTVQAGESLAILGANGSGKSTLLKLLDGLYFPSQGTITAFDQPLTEQALDDEATNFAFRPRVGLVFQDADVQLFSPSVLEEVAFAPLQLGLEREELAERVESSLRALGIGDLAGRAPHRLSGGEKRKVALASILSLQPEVWLLDEPTTGLDPRSQSWLIDFIREQNKAGKTLVTATHDLSVAEAIAARICVFGMDHQIVATGATEEILGNHELLHACDLAHYHLARKHD
ncbi:MAG: energy-coupling factor ABC transporter ATP-binding protein [Acidobacteriota bacterium]